MIIDAAVRAEVLGDFLRELWILLKAASAAPATAPETRSRMALNPPV
jgi:hypothetical protein